MANPPVRITTREACSPMRAPALDPPRAKGSDRQATAPLQLGMVVTTPFSLTRRWSADRPPRSHPETRRREPRECR